MREGDEVEIIMLGSCLRGRRGTILIIKPSPLNIPELDMLRISMPQDGDYVELNFARKFLKEVKPASAPQNT